MRNHKWSAKYLKTESERVRPVTRAKYVENEDTTNDGGLF